MLHMAPPNSAKRKIEPQHAKHLRGKLAEGVRRVMEAKGLSVRRLAVRMHTSRSLLYRLLSGQQDSITLRSIARLAVALQVTISVHIDEP